jgi:hypothetical protein
MQEIFLPVKVVRYWQENGHLKFEMALKSIDFIPFKNVLRLIDSLVRQSRTISDNQHGAEIRSTVALTGSHPPGIQKKTKIRLACLLVSCMWNVFGIRLAIRKTGNISHHFQIPAASVIPIAFRQRCGCQQKSLSIDPPRVKRQSGRIHIQFPSSSRY